MLGRATFTIAASDTIKNDARQLTNRINVRSSGRRRRNDATAVDGVSGRQQQQTFSIRAIARSDGGILCLPE
jgi:hypothetical protein